MSTPRPARLQPMMVWIDGAIVDGHEASISVLDHGLLYGDGIFEGIRTYARRVFRLDDHLARLALSAKAIGLTLPHPVDAIRNIVLDTLCALGRDDAYVRLVVTRGEGALGVDATSCPTPRLFCLAAEAQIYPLEKSTSPRPQASRTFCTSGSVPSARRFTPNTTHCLNRVSGAMKT